MYESEMPATGVQFAQAMGGLDQWLDVLADTDVAELDPAVLGEATLQLLSMSRRFAAVQARVSDRFATSGVWADSGARSARAWVASQTNEPVGRVTSVINTGARMRNHPHMAEALAAGEINAQHVEIFATTVKDYPSVAAHIDELEESLVDIARLCEPKRFQSELTAICHSLDPTAVQADERKRDSEAYLHLSGLRDGMWRIDGLLPSEVGSHLQSLLDAARRRLRAEAKDAEQEQPKVGAEPSGESEDEVIGIDVMGNGIHAHETPTAAMDNRFGSRRNIDALRLILNLAAPAKNDDGTIALPSVNGSRPVVHLTVDIESLLDETAAKAAAWLERFGVPTHVISAAKAGLLACDSVIEPMIIKDGQLVATLPSLQTVPAHLRKAVIRRDEQCRINSCIAPIDEVHHLIYLSQGGPTTMSNLAGLCWFHHHLIHDEEWTLTGDGNGELILRNTLTGQQWLNRPPRKRE